MARRYPNGKKGVIRVRWMEGEALRQLTLGLTYRQIVRSIEAGIRVMERKARLLGLDMPTKVAVTDPDRGIPLETIRRVMERVDRLMAEVDVTPAKPAQLEPPTSGDDDQQ